jgi:hypothetical protein
MGDTQARTRAEAEADKALAPRREALVALSLAAQEAGDVASIALAAVAARKGATVRAKARRRADAVLARTQRRVDSILSAAEREAEALDKAVMAEMVARTDAWRGAHDAAIAAGWTAKELKAREQLKPPRERTPRGTRRPKGAESRPGTPASRTDTQSVQPDTETGSATI